MPANQPSRPSTPVTSALLLRRLSRCLCGLNKYVVWCSCSCRCRRRDTVITAISTCIHIRSPMCKKVMKLCTHLLRPIEHIRDCRNRRRVLRIVRYNLRHSTSNPRVRVWLQLHVPYIASMVLEEDEDQFIDTGKRDARSIPGTCLWIVSRRDGPANAGIQVVSNTCWPRSRCI